MKSIAIENTWLGRQYMDFGWGNGYVFIPEGHPMHGKHYDEINNHVEVHYGLTFSAAAKDCKGEMLAQFEITDEDLNCWIVGFDTAHHNDSLSSWPKEAVEAETKRLAEQLENIKTT